MKIKIDYNKCKPEDRKYLMKRLDDGIDLCLKFVFLFWLLSLFSLVIFNFIAVIVFVFMEFIFFFGMKKQVDNFEKIYNAHFKYAEKSKPKQKARNRNMDKLACLMWVIAGELMILLFPSSFISFVGIVILSISVVLLGYIVGIEENGRK